MTDAAARGKAQALLHDQVNLPLVAVLLAVTFWSFGEDPALQDRSTLLTWCTIAYVLFDSAYLLAFPACTLRLGSLLLHHLATLALAVMALRLDVTFLTSKCMLVEINTLMLTLHKTTKIAFFQTLMIATWFGLRLGLYPYLLYYFHNYFSDQARYSGWSVYLQVVPSLLVLNVLNVFWTLEFLGVGGAGKAKKKP